MDVRIGIVIATRNRPIKLRRVLNSLADSSFTPKEVIVVSSGDEISDLISDFASRLRIKHRHIDGYGQIRQKIDGLSLVSKEIDWVLFLDDDLIVDREALNSSAKFISSNAESEDIIGIGFDLEQTSKVKDARKFKKFVARVFLLDGQRGEILKSGHPVAYLGSAKPIRTKWLIGASMWRKDLLENYFFDFLDSKYSAFEDVIFSNRCSKFGNLIYLPQSKLQFQDDSVTKESKDIYISASYWRFYFVYLNKHELSVIAFLWSQLGRSIFFLISDFSGGAMFFNKTRIVMTTYGELIFQVVIKKDPIWSLNRHCRLRTVDKAPY